jgi:pimeloyl-ACP methyl ester carboxylesterase
MMRKLFIFLLLVAFGVVSCNRAPQDGKMPITTKSETALVDYGSNEKVGNYIDVNGIKIYYEIYGEGEPLLLLHGNSGSINSFGYQIPELSKHFKVIAVDSRAQGRSSDSKKEITYALMASDMSELIEKLKLGSVYVVGWSDGGNIGLELALNHPGKIKKLITFGANFTWENFFATPDSVTMDPNDPLIVKVTPILQKYKAGMDKITPEIKKKLSTLMEKFPNLTVEQLRQIKIPVLVVAGDHDLINIDHTVTLFKNLPHAQLFIVPGAAHTVVVEQPELINSEIIKFLNTPYRDIDSYYLFKFLQ